MIWITLNLMTHQLRVYQSYEAATKDSLNLNRAHSEHPAFRLWSYAGNGKQPKYEGRLFRDFGCEFDEKNPWKKSLE